MSGNAGHQGGLSDGRPTDDEFAGEEAARDVFENAADRLERAAAARTLDMTVLKPALEVRRRHAEKAITEEPVVTDLVAALLADSELASLPEGVRATLAERVGVVLLTDPSTYLRLERLWTALKRADH